MTEKKGGRPRHVKVEAAHKRVKVFTSKGVLVHDSDPKAGRIHCGQKLQTELSIPRKEADAYVDRGLVFITSTVDEIPATEDDHAAEISDTTEHPDN